MNEIKCPKCGTVFQIDEQDYESIVKQIRNHEFEKELEEKDKQFEKELKSKVELTEANIRQELMEEINKLKLDNADLKSKLDSSENDRNNAIKNTKYDIEKIYTDKINELTLTKINLENEIKLKDKEYEIKETNLKDSYEGKLKDKDEQIAYYKDFKAKQSTKMIGESLEQHCNTEFNRVRTLFPNCTFSKDNDAKTGSKGDFIFRCYADDTMKDELVSIMFEMKNEADETATKHKNEDFFKELNKDREEKNCEYAVLVTMLEADNDYYNDGIVDVSYVYDKMYVIRPQFFVPIITLITNLSKKSLDYKKELTMIREQNIDITNFEEKINSFKEGFSRNYRLASDKFKKAIEEIDKTILTLQKTKEDLLSSDNNLRLANNKMEDLTISKLTRNNKTMTEMFNNAKKED